MVTHEQAKEILDDLEQHYAERHFQHRRLRDFWHGRYWDTIENQPAGIASIFRDAASTTDFGPDMKLVRNLVFDVTVKYQSFLSNLPMIRTFADRPESRRSRAQAQTKERVLYGSWDHADMGIQLNKLGWYGPLMGDCFLGIWPDMDASSVKAVVRSPEHAFPLPNAEGTGTDALLFRWHTTEGRAKRAFPAYKGDPQAENGKHIEVLEWSDTRQFYRWVDGQQTNAVEHNLGFNLFDQVPFIHVPGEPWNHGAVEQYVGLVEAGNALYSLMMQAMIENVFPRLILEDPLKFSETIDTGPGATIGVNPGGKAYFLTPPADPLTAGALLLQENERAVKQGTSMPDVNFGQFDASIITGKAVNALQGAGTGSLVDMIQGCGHGPALVNWNVKALTIYQRMFADDTIYLQGVKPSSLLDINPRQFAISFKGKEIVGSPRNDVVFGPYIDQHGKLVMALQAQGAGLTSKAFGREQIGISDSAAMQEEIVEEALDDAVVGAIIQAMQEPTPAAADNALGQAVGYLEGNTGPVRARPPGAQLTPPAAPAGANGPQFASLPGGGQVSAPALPLPPGAALAKAGAPAGAAPQGPGGTSPAPAGTTITLPLAQAQLGKAQLQGRAWLVGQIVQEGATTGPVEVAVTDNADKQTLADAARFPITFHLVAGKPKEQSVEIRAAQPAAA